MMLDKPMMRVLWREWAEEVKKDIVDDEDIYEYKFHHQVITLRNVKLEE